MSDETPRLAETAPAPNGEPLPGPTVDDTNVTTDEMLVPPTTVPAIRRSVRNAAK